MYDFPGDVQCIEAFFVILPLPRRVASDVAIYVILLNLLNNPFLDKNIDSVFISEFLCKKKKNQTIFFVQEQIHNAIPPSRIKPKPEQTTVSEPHQPVL